ncbi:signal peptidase I [Bacillus cereus]|uniref:Signal peptidase I n=1 Tax=Bacillus arachidis TaxID=2819290 RepID=A0ABS3NUK6_9BACI|nr:MULTISPECIES: signal peptidase I [Bacillus]PGY01762.1 signal peptidase I [Bacillus cereus]MBO1624225.1 signal peptidase I [Bacillus arachidis]PFE04024.1 signal peptidase I [Bacillus sp. AFS023182]WIY62458.1 signal peptidase I [Bacillus arachidis]SDZ00377.1 Signal peptidase I Serine peptidase. MEROPS family S26B [Bacillus sp. 166amftsu]
MKLVWKIISNVISFVLFALMVCLAFVVISSKASGGDPTVMGYQFKTVLSGSMEPTFLTGSIIAIEPTKDGSKYKKGDVITFKEDEKKIVTHRIIGVKNANGKVMYETKGDNNNGPDLKPVLAENVIGKYADITVPYVGYLLSYASSKAGAALLLIIPGVCLLMYSVITIFSAIRSIDNEKKNKSTDVGQSV